jgi:tetratricopeptide (TPR) repeat protein
VQESTVHEVDLSDEWAALSQQLESAMQEEPELAPRQTPAPQMDEAVPSPVLVPEDAAHGAADATSEASAYDFELQPDEAKGIAQTDTRASDSMISDLAGDLDSFASSLGISNAPPLPPLAPPKNSIAASVEHTPRVSANAPGNGAKAPATSGSLEGPLGDLFEEFRSELGETKEDEDLETHYNLGIAYREMGLLEEAISEFQKVASFADKGPAFRYAMQCSTLLGLAFMEKGQPAIAAIWYERALKTPGLDQESILALRYDLGIAQELAGDEKAAFNSFSQVYALNIDYRDVSERIAVLGKTR